MRLAPVATLALLLLAGCSQGGGDPATSTTATDGPALTVRAGDTVGYYRVQEVHADRLEGLYRYPYPVARGEGEPRTLRVGDEVGAACEGRTYVLASIDAGAGTATFTPKEHAPQPGGCPICLAATALIDTPDGPVAVQDVHVGMTVWAIVDGQRAAVEVEKASRTPAPDHVVVRLALDDGRALDASPGHPLADGRLVGEVRAGDVVDGARVASADLVPYEGAFTHDILAGEAYWADGILVASTLAR